jgi:hypothetical protein
MIIIAMATAASWIVMQILPKPLADKVWWKSMELAGLNQWSYLTPSPSLVVQNADRDQEKISNWVVRCKRVPSLEFLDADAQILLGIGRVSSLHEKDQVNVVS